MYTINVDRGSRQLEFRVSGAVQGGFPTPCWWDPLKVIAAGSYTGCSTTRMSTKKDSVTSEPRPGVYIPNVPSFRGIFIHEGKSERWSDGCIVCDRARVLEIFNAVPRDQANITVVVID